MYNNYRPIAILPAVEKVLEEVIVRQLTSSLRKYKIVIKNQFGFQKRLNRNKLLGNFSNLTNSCLNKRLNCLVLFVDFSKAFGTLTHSKLLQMLQRIEVRGITLNWFKNYLECRTYRVRICGKNSEKVPIDCGVPRSKFGLILYLIYANEMINALQLLLTLTIPQ